ncbi:beta strand repeat-containing protein, partial [Thauera aromatica]|uniref:beta strand repeat-containing protein n=1 Tax=Thauera aromatica TaxID=59405 RepID=UPI001FFC4BEC|nr:Ig-like domain-containing protein [Thauera aromatica]
MISALSLITKTIDVKADLLSGRSTEITNLKLAELKNGGFVAGWIESDNQVYYAIFDNAGTTDGSHLISSHASNSSNAFDVAALEDGGFVIAHLGTISGANKGVVNAFSYNAGNYSKNTESYFADSNNSVPNPNGDPSVNHLWPLQDLSIAALSDGGFVIGSDSYSWVNPSYTPLGDFVYKFAADGSTANFTSTGTYWMRVNWFYNQQNSVAEVVAFTGGFASLNRSLDNKWEITLFNNDGTRITTNQKTASVYNNGGFLNQTYYATDLGNVPASVVSWNLGFGLSSSVNNFVDLVEYNGSIIAILPNASGGFDYTVISETTGTVTTAATSLGMTVPSGTTLVNPQYYPSGSGFAMTYDAVSTTTRNDATYGDLDYLISDAYQYDIFTTGPANTNPTISDVGNQTTTEGTATSGIAVTIGDTETDANSLTLAGASSNTTLIPDANIVVTGTGANRTVTITPADNQTGTATITLTVTDGGSAMATDTFTVTVNDVNPAISDVTLSVNENASNGTSVGTVSATGDTNGLIYSITGGNIGSVFAIDSGTGEITVAGSLNYEGTASYSLTVAVDDEDADTTADSTATITVNLNDVNETPTDLALGATSFNNSQAAGTTLTTITGTDPDSSAPNDTLTYSLVSGSGDTDNARFEISGTSLKVASGGALGAGTYNLRLRATDAGTGSLSYEETFSVTVTDAAPTLSSASPADNATGVAITGNVVLTFSEAIAAGTGDIVLYDITGAGADTRTIDVTDSSQLTISGNTLTINPSTDLLTTNQYAVKMASGVIVDGSAQAYAGIADNSTLNFSTGTVDSTAPSVTLVDVTSPTQPNAGTVTINFSEQVQNVDITDFTLTRGGSSVDISGLTVNGSGAQYTLDLSSVTSIAGSYVLTLNTSNITDTTGNALASGTSESFVIDTTAPTGTTIVRASANPMGSGMASFTVAFSEAVSSVTADDFTLTGTATSGASVGAVTQVSDSVYRVAVTGVSGNGTLGLDLNSSGTGITDLAGNALSGGITGQLFTVDGTAPTVTAINRNGAAVINGTSTSFTVSFDEAVTGVDSGDFSLDASGLTGSIASVTGSGSTYTVTVDNLAGATGTVSIDLNSSGTGITDTAGNASATGYTAGETVTRGTTAPTVTSGLSFNLPENMSSGFVIGQVAASDTHGVASYAIASGNDDGFFAIDASGVLTLTTAGAASGAASSDYETTPNAFTLGITATDSAGNVSGSETVTVNVLDEQEDSTPPAITITSDKTALKAGETATIAFTLSEAATDFTADDVTVVGGTLSNFTGSGTSYSATFTPTADSSAAASISVASDQFSDAAGNANADGADTDNAVTMTVDTIRPTIAVTSDKTALKAGETATITFTLSESATDFTAGD